MALIVDGNPRVLVLPLSSGYVKLGDRARAAGWDRSQSHVSSATHVAGGQTTLLQTGLGVQANNVLLVVGTDVVLGYRFKLRTVGTAA